MSYIIEGKKNKYELTVGCEIHTQVASSSKLFSRSDTSFGAKQNSQVSLVDAAMPGMLPTINEDCVKQAVKTGLGINGKINLKSIFDRKNYFYPDSPQGYQISQFSDPIIGEGKVEISLSNGETKLIRVERIHLEQDAGKSIHDQDPSLSFIDLNRCGVALMEIVSMPDMTTPEEVTQYVKAVRSIVRSLGTSDGDMEKGNLRCDANVSVKLVGATELGTRCEIKNLNSFRNISRAVEYEAQRQVDLLEEGIEVSQETRLFDAVNCETRTMRSKEDAMDYRYFPDPDLPPLVITQEFVDDIKKVMPELPNDKKKRYIKDLSISEYDAGVLTSDTEISAYFEELIENHEPRICVTWLSVELLGRMNKSSISFDKLKVSAPKLSGLLDLIKDGTISGKIAKDVLDIMVESGDEASKIIEDKGLKQVSDTGAIEKILDEILENNQDKLEQYRSGKDKLFGFFVGQAMKATKGQANPKVVNDILKEKLSK